MISIKLWIFKLKLWFTCFGRAPIFCTIFSTFIIFNTFISERKTTCLICSWLSPWLSCTYCFTLCYGISKNYLKLVLFTKILLSNLGNDYSEKCCCQGVYINLCFLIPPPPEKNIGYICKDPFIIKSNTIVLQMLSYRNLFLMRSYINQWKYVSTYLDNLTCIVPIGLTHDYHYCLLKEESRIIYTYLDTFVVFETWKASRYLWRTLYIDLQLYCNNSK